MAAWLYEYTKNQWALYTSYGWTVRYMNYIPIKLFYYNNHSLNDDVDVCWVAGTPASTGDTTVMETESSELQGDRK